MYLKLKRSENRFPKNNIWETAEKEKEIVEYSAVFDEELYKKIASCNIKGVWKVKGNCITVCKSYLGPGNILSAEYCIQESQAELVKRFIGKAEGIRNLLWKVGQMVADRSAKFPEGRMPLNSSTLRVLEDFLQGDA